MTPDECEWSYESDDDAWETGCGALFQFSAGGPEENAFHFCCYCGGKLAVKLRAVDAYLKTTKEK